MTHIYSATTHRHIILASRHNQKHFFSVLHRVFEQTQDDKETMIQLLEETKRKSRKEPEGAAKTQHYTISEGIGDNILSPTNLIIHSIERTH